MSDIWEYKSSFLKKKIVERFQNASQSYLQKMSDIKYFFCNAKQTLKYYILK